MKTQRTLRINTVHQTRIDNIVMRHNHQHREDSEKFNVRTSYPPPRIYLSLPQLRPFLNLSTKVFLSQNNITDSIHIFQRQICIQRQSQHTQCQMLCHRGLLCSCGRIIPVALKAVCQRIEVFSGRDALLRQHLKNLIAGVFVPIKHDREIRVIAFYIFLNRTELDAFYARKALTVTFHDLLAFGDFLVQMPQVADAHSCLKFVHLALPPTKQTDSVHGCQSSSDHSATAPSRHF